MIIQFQFYQQICVNRFFNNFLFNDWVFLVEYQSFKNYRHFKDKRCIVMLCPLFCVKFGFQSSSLTILRKTVKNVRLEFWQNKYYRVKRSIITYVNHKDCGRCGINCPGEREKCTYLCTYG